MDWQKVAKFLHGEAEARRRYLGNPRADNSARLKLEIVTQITQLLADALLAGLEKGK